MARLFDLEPEQVHIVAPDVGGGFGPKICGYPEDVFVAWAARFLGRPLRWTETRSENMVGLHHGRGQIVNVALGGARSGRIDAYEIEVIGDAGAYTSLGAYTPSSTLRMTTGAYTIPPRQVGRVGSSRTPHQPRRTAAPVARKLRTRSSEWWISSRPRSARIPCWYAGATSSAPTRSRTPPPSARCTTAATTPRHSTASSTRSTTADFERSRPRAASAATACNSGSG